MVGVKNKISLNSLRMNREGKYLSEPIQWAEFEKMRQLTTTLTAGRGSSANEQNSIYNNAMYSDVFPSHVCVVVGHVS